MLKKLKLVTTIFLIILFISLSLVSNAGSTPEFSITDGQKANALKELKKESNEELHAKYDKMIQVPTIDLENPISNISNTYDKYKIKNNEEKIKEQKELIDEYTTKDPVIFVEYKNNADKKEIKENAKKKLNIVGLEAVCSFEDVNAETLRVDTKENMMKLIEELKKDKDVKNVGSDYIPIDLFAAEPTNDPYFSNQWGLYNSGNNIDIAAYSGWKSSTGSCVLPVAVIDSGIDITHPDLASNIYINSAEIANNGIDDDGNGYIDDVNGWDFFNNDKTVYDSGESDHGTHISGIIAAADNNIGTIGVAPSAKILPLKITNLSGKITRASAVINALHYAHSRSIRIANCSWGMWYFDPLYSSADISTIIDLMTIQYHNILFVCSAGNDGTQLISTTVPAGLSYSTNIIAVGAANSQGNLTGLSNFGSRVSLAAPGEHIYSTVPGGTCSYYDGTSQAAPFVTGIAQLLLSNNINMSSMDLKSSILNNARPISQLNGQVNNNLFACAATPNTPSINITSVSPTTATFTVKYPYEKMYGNGLYLWDFTTNSFVQSTNDWYLKNGSYTFNNLVPGCYYTAQLYWYTDKNTQWQQRIISNVYVTAALTNGASICPTEVSPTNCYIKLIIQVRECGAIDWKDGIVLLVNGKIFRLHTIRKMACIIPAV